jgi:hypothetical protein
MTKWLETIIESASVATITIDVAEENPPRKLRIANPSWPCDKGTVRTNKSGFAFAGKRSRPITAIGTTNRLINIR